MAGGRPRQFPDRATLTLRLEPNLKERAASVADAKGMALNEYIVQLLARSVSRAENQAKR